MANSITANAIGSINTLIQPPASIAEGGVKFIYLSIILVLAVFTIYFIANGVYMGINDATDSAFNTDSTIKNTKKIDKSNFSSLSTEEFYRLNGVSVNDITRAKINDMNTANKIASDVSGNTANLVVAHYNPDDLVINANGEIHVGQSTLGSDQDIQNNRSLVEAKMRGRVFRSDETTDDNILYSVEMLLGDIESKKEFNNIIWLAKSNNEKSLWMSETPIEKIPLILDQRNQLDFLVKYTNDPKSFKNNSSVYLSILFDNERLKPKELDDLVPNIDKRGAIYFQDLRFVSRLFHTLKVAKGDIDKAKVIISTYLPTSNLNSVATAFIRMSNEVCCDINDRTRDCNNINGVSPDIVAKAFFMILDFSHFKGATPVNNVHIITAPMIYSKENTSSLIMNLTDIEVNYIVNIIWLKYSTLIIGDQFIRAYDYLFLSYIVDKAPSDLNSRYLHPIMILNNNRLQNDVFNTILSTRQRHDYVLFLFNQPNHIDPPNSDLLKQFMSVEVILENAPNASDPKIIGKLLAEYIDYCYNKEKVDIFISKTLTDPSMSLYVKCIDRISYLLTRKHQLTIDSIKTWSPTTNEDQRTKFKDISNSIMKPRLDMVAEYASFRTSINYTLLSQQPPMLILAPRTDLTFEVVH